MLRRTFGKGGRGPVMVEVIRRTVLALGFWAVALSTSVAGEPPSEPILRIESGMHTGQLRRIGVDAANRFLVTAGDDATVRVWELRSARLLRVLRPPIAPGTEGKLYGMAISPDGRTIACGGLTGHAWDGRYSVYLFDRESGRLVGRLADLPDFIAHLAFSPDGRFLVVAFGGPSGIRVYRTGDWAVAAEDRDYGDGSFWAEFDRFGRLVASGRDGLVRLYDASFRLIARAAVPGSREPVGVSVSPDGATIAVGLGDQPQVAFLSSANLALLSKADTGGAVATVVAWSADGRAVYAGGVLCAQDLCHIRKWDARSGWRFVDLPASRSRIMDIRPLNAGGIAYGASDPAFGLFNAADRQELAVGPPLADYRNAPDGLQVSSDGMIVGFFTKAGGQGPARFAIQGRALESGPVRDSRLSSPRTSAPGLQLTDWRDSPRPKLNGQSLPLQPFEIARGVAILPDLRAFVLASDWALRLFDASGALIWGRGSPGIPWAINITGTGRALVAALDDGTIRWFRVQDGQELLALFPHPDQRRWALWTPSGYYDASPGGEDFIGWHVNRGKDQAADFFPASQFRSTYYRPDIVAKVLEVLDEGEAVQVANAEAGRKSDRVALARQLPPVVRILAPADGAEQTGTEVLVRFSVRSESGEPVTAVKALVNGRPAVTQRGIAVKPDDRDVQELRVTIPERDAEIAVLAENRFATSEPARVRVAWKGRPAGEEFVVKPKLYALAVGVSQYANKTLALGFAAKDAQDFATALQAQQGGLYREVATKVLSDAQATKDEILDGLEWLQRQTTSKDVAMVFLAGHGVNDPTGVYYFLPVNADPEKLKRTGVAFSDIKNTIASLAGKTIAFIDTCHSGNIMGARRGVADITAVVNELASADSGAVVFASSTGNQYSLEDQAWNNGAFTKALVEGLSGKADYAGKGKITVNMLDLYLSERVKELTKGQQTPTTTKPQTVPDFPVAVKRG